MSTSRIKSESLSCRISPEHKRLIEKAAQVFGFSTSDFVIHTLVNVASETLRDESVIRLDKDEWNRFTSSIDRPPREPGEATQKAMELFKLGRNEDDRQIW
ncbi:MAG: DUF1778 domain-containing protein [bacterium]|nr:DUF1778 domain-containing protein [bacterium]